MQQNTCSCKIEIRKCTVYKIIGQQTHTHVTTLKLYKLEEQREQLTQWNYGYKSNELPERRTTRTKSHPGIMP